VVGLPNANFGANNTVICTSNSVQFTDQSGGLPTQRFWYFPGGNPATSTALNPIVNYATAGSYPVALRINNALGSDSIYIENYITVGGLTLPFTETFNDNSPTRSRWTINNPNADTTWRLVDVPGNISGNKAYCMPFYNYSAIGRRDRLDSPPLSLRGFTQPVLTIDHAYARYPQQASDSLVVWISTNCGSTWIRVFSRGENGTKNFSTVNDRDTEFNPADSSEWCSSNCISIPLTTYSGANNFRIRIEGYNNYGNNMFVDNIRITGSPIKPVVNFTAAKTNACTNEPIGFTDLSTNFPTTWQWEAPGAIISNPNIKNPIIRFPTVGTYTVKLVAANGAGTDSTVKVNFIQVVQGPAVPNITSTGTMLCTGDSATLRTDSIADNYQWLKDGFAIQNQTSQNYTTYITGLYRIRVSATNGCILLSDTVRVMVNERPAKPVLTSNLTNGQLCEGGTAILTSNILDNNVWFRNNQAMSGVSGRQINVANGGNYKVQIVEGGCAGDFSDSVTINLLLKPQTTDLVGPSGVKPGTEHTYSVTGSSGSIYNWIVIGGQRTGSSNAISVVWGNGPTGNIQVRETATNGCQGDLKSMAIIIGVNQSLVENQDYFSSLKMYPVPASNILHLTHETNIAAKAEVKLMNTIGQLIEKKTWEWHAGENEITFNISGIAPGMYFVEVISEGNKTVRKVQIKD
jgi:PKD repeat protein